MKNKITIQLLITIAIVVVNICHVKAQSPSNPFDWKLDDHYYSYDDAWGGCPGSSWAKSAALLSTGDLVVAGNITEGDYSHYYDICYNKLVISKYNSSGQITANYFSSNTKNGSGRDVLQIAAASNDDIFVLGTTDQNTNVVIKLNSSLSEQWKFNFQKMSDIYIDADQAGNLIMAYIKPDTGSASGKMIVIKKYSALDGSVIYTRYYKDNQDNHIRTLKDMKVDANDNIYFCGSVNSLSRGSRYLTVKFNGQGDYQWSRFFDGQPSADGDEAYALEIDHNQGLIVTGYSFRTANQVEAATVMYSSNGWFQWVRRSDVDDNYYNGGFYDYSSYIKVDANDHIYVVASKGHGGLWSYSDMRSVLLKYNNNGSQIFKRNFSDTKVYSLAVSSQGICYLGGTKHCDYSICPDYPFAGLGAVLKINNAGNIEWDYNTQASGTQTGYEALFNSIFINETTNEAWFSGNEHANYQLSHNFSWITAHINSALRMAGNLESKDELSIYPNPATDYLQIVFTREIDQAQLTIFDLQGREVIHQNITSNDETINVSELKPGVYVARIVYDGNLINKKFVKE